MSLNISDPLSLLAYQSGLTDPPLVEAARGLAARLDDDSSDAGMWREYRFVLRDLMGLVGTDVGDDLEAEFAALDG